MSTMNELGNHRGNLSEIIVSNFSCIVYNWLLLTDENAHFHRSQVE